jgi:hypothetical protein
MEIDDYLEVLARKSGVDEGEAVKRSIAFYLWFLDLRQQGGTLYVKFPDGTVGEPLFNLTSSDSNHSQGTL